MLFRPLIIKLLPYLVSFLPTECRFSTFCHLLENRKTNSLYIGVRLSPKSIRKITYYESLLHFAVCCSTWSNVFEGIVVKHLLYCNVLLHIAVKHLLYYNVLLHVAVCNFSNYRLLEELHYNKSLST